MGEGRWAGLLGGGGQEAAAAPRGGVEKVLIIELTELWSPPLNSSVGCIEFLGRFFSRQFIGTPLLTMMSAALW
jgi:hypothetical protein